MAQPGACTVDRCLKVDYDQIAPTYDRRFEGEGQRNTARVLLELARDLGATRILEVGCGTGRWLSELLPVTDELVGLDLSFGMLRQARKQGAGLLLLQGRASRIPFVDHSFDLVYCVNAIHHFSMARAFVLEGRRLLRPGGALAVVGTDPRQHGDRWYIYDFFAGTFERDLARFPSWGQTLDWMAEAGFAGADWRIVEYIRSPRQGGQVWDDPFLHKNATSQLALLTDEEYAEGLGRIRVALAAAEQTGETLVFPVEILLRMLVGRVPRSV